jgi:hypothetical protein
MNHPNWHRPAAPRPRKSVGEQVQTVLLTFGVWIIIAITVWAVRTVVPA